MKSTWKLPFISSKFFKKNLLEKKNINIINKNSIIPSCFFKKNNLKINIFNGIWYLSLFIKNNMKGYKFGEFILTKKFENLHLKKKRNLKKK